MTFGEMILAVVNFLTYPSWHLIAFFVFVLLIVAWNFYYLWFSKNIS